MSARYEITDDGAQIRIKSPDGSLSTIIGTPRSTHIEDAVIGAIRQQARDLDQLHTDLAAAVSRAEQAEARLAAIDAAPVVHCAWVVINGVNTYAQLIARPAKD